AACGREANARSRKASRSNGDCDRLEHGRRHARLLQHCLDHGNKQFSLAGACLSESGGDGSIRITYSSGTRTQSGIEREDAHRVPAPTYGLRLENTARLFERKARIAGK